MMGVRAVRLAWPGPGAPGPRSQLQRSRPPHKLRVPELRDLGGRLSISLPAEKSWEGGAVARREFRWERLRSWPGLGSH